MATSKTLSPTGVAISIPGFTDAPDQRVNSNCIDKEADAINSLQTNKANVVKLLSTDTVAQVYAKLYALPTETSVPIAIEGTAMSSLTGGAYTGYSFGNVSKIGTNTYRFTLMTGTSKMLVMYVSSISSSSWGTPTINEISNGKTGMSIGSISASSTGTLKSLGFYANKGAFLIVLKSDNAYDGASAYIFRDNGTYQTAIALHEGTDASTPIIASGGVLKLKSATTAGTVHACCIPLREWT